MAIFIRGEEEDFIFFFFHCTIGFLERLPTINISETKQYSLRMLTS